MSELPLPDLSISDPGAIDAGLHFIADRILHDLVSGTVEPSIVQVATGDSGAVLRTRPLEGSHPTPLLLGLTAPLDWYAVGMATAAWAYELNSPGERRHRSHHVLILSRSGEVVSRLHCEEPSFLTGQPAEQPVGEVLDVLRRVLRLPTPPPAHGPELWWASQWLAAVHDDRLRRWPSVARAHPILALLGDETDPDELLPAVSAARKVFTWRRLRHLCATDRMTVSELGAGDALWLDDGAFARWALNRTPDLTAVHGGLVGVLRPQVRQRIDAALAAWNIDPSNWNDVRFSGAA